jgi:hypothetical protein
MLTCGMKILLLGLLYLNGVKQRAIRTPLLRLVA